MAKTFSRYTNSLRTICEVHREMWDIIEDIEDETVKEKLQERLITVYDMGERMTRKLREYKKEWDGGFWEKNLDSKEDEERRKKKG